MSGEILVLLKKAAHFSAEESIEGQSFSSLIAAIKRSTIAYFLLPNNQQSAETQYFPVESIENNKEQEKNAVMALRMLIETMMTLNDDAHLTLEEFTVLIEGSSKKLADLPSSWKKKWSKTVDELKSVLSHKLEIFLQELTVLNTQEDSWNGIDSATRTALEALKGQPASSAHPTPKNPALTTSLVTKFSSMVPKALLSKNVKLPEFIAEIRLSTMQEHKLFKRLIAVHEKLTDGPEKKLLTALIELQQRNEQELTGKQIDELCLKHTPNGASKAVTNIVFDINQVVITRERDLKRKISLEREKAKGAPGEPASSTSSSADVPPVIRRLPKKGTSPDARGNRIASVYLQESTFRVYSYMERDKPPVAKNMLDDEQDDEKITNPFATEIAAAQQRRVVAEQRIAQARINLRMAIIQQSTAQRQIRSIAEVLLQQEKSVAQTSAPNTDIEISAAAPPPPPPPAPPAMMSSATTALVITRKLQTTTVKSDVVSSTQAGASSAIKAVPASDLHEELTSVLKRGIARKVSTSRKATVQNRTEFPQTEAERQEEEKRLQHLLQSAFEAKDKQLTKLTEEKGLCVKEINQIATAISEVASRITALQAIPRQELFNIVFQSRLNVALQEAQKAEEEATRAEQEVSVEEQVAREAEEDVTRKLAQAEALGIESITLKDDDNALNALLQKPLERKTQQAAAGSSSSDAGTAGDIKINLVEDLKAAFRAKRIGVTLKGEDEDDEIITKLDVELEKQNTLEQQWRKLQGRVVELDFQIKAARLERDSLRAKLGQPTSSATVVDAVQRKKGGLGIVS